jgi:hypothetical protein
MLLLACAPSPEPEVDLREEEQAIRGLLEQVLVFYEDRDANAMADLCDNPILMSGRIVRGRENIKEHWEGFLGGLGDAQMTILASIST